MCAKPSLLGDLPLCAKPVLVEHLLNAKTRLGEPVPTVCQDLHRCCMLQMGGTQILMPKYKGTGRGGAASGGLWHLQSLLGVRNSGTKDPGVRVTGKPPSVRGNQCVQRHASKAHLTKMADVET